MTAIRIHPDAAGEVREAAQWYQERAGLGDEFASEVEQLLDRLIDAPEAFPRWTPNPKYRKALMIRFPHILFFRLTDCEIQILAVAHAKRRPGYWLHRSR